MKETSYDLSELKPEVAGKNAACSGDSVRSGLTRNGLVVSLKNIGMIFRSQCNQTAVIGPG